MVIRGREMNVIFISEIERVNNHRQIAKRTQVERVLAIEDDGTEDGGRTIAKFWDRKDAFAVAEAMGWVVSNELSETLE